MLRGDFFHHSTIAHNSPEDGMKFYMKFVKTDYFLKYEGEYYIKKLKLPGYKTFV